MGVIEALVLGVIQGLTEFLPVSSSGHLVLFQNIFGLQGEHLFFDTMLHVGTLVAVFVVLWRDVLGVFKSGRLFLMLVVATLPAVAAQILFGDFFESAFGGAFLGWSFLITAVLLTVAELVAANLRTRKKEVTYPCALTMGVMQAVAILPGVSRSGSTLTGGLFFGLNRNKAVRFSFLMSIPVILGSVVLQGYKVIKTGALDTDIGVTLAGMAAAAVSGYFAIRFMLELVRRHKLYGFAIYTAVLGVFVLLDQGVFGLIF